MNPNADLTPNTTYTARVLGGASGAKDTGRNALAADRVWSFTVATDTTPPTVVSVLPTEEATGVAVASNVEVVFSEAMDATTLTSTTVTLTQDGGAVAATVTYDDAAKKAILDPSADLTPATTYTATVKGGASGAKDTSGLPLAADKTWSFTTADVTAPTVTSVAPADAATGVAAGANVAAVFSEAMDAATLTTATFTLVRQGTTTPVAAPVTYDAAAKRATLDPDANLAAGATYTATVKGGASGAKDLAGNPLAADRVWSFTTAGTTMTAAVEADAWVESANPSLNHGTDQFLSIDNSPLSEGFLRFTVSGAGDISQAKLRLYAYNGTDNAPKVYRVTDNSWSETGITWSTKPARSGTPVDTTSLVPTNSWVEYDVSSMVTANGTYTFNLVPDTGDLLQVRSREYAADPTLRPQLVLTVGAPGGPETMIDPPHPGQPDQPDECHVHLLLESAGHNLRVQARRLGLRGLHFAEAVHRPGRRAAHVRGAGDRRGRQPGRDAGGAHLDGRHDAADGGDRGAGRWRAERALDGERRGDLLRGDGPGDADRGDVHAGRAGERQPRRRPGQPRRRRDEGDPEPRRGSDARRNLQRHGQHRGEGRGRQHFGGRLPLVLHRGGHHAAGDQPRLAAAGQPHQPDERHVHLLDERAGRDLRVPARRRGLGELHESEQRDQSDRRRPHLRGARHRRGGQRRYHAGGAHLDGRHDAADGDHPRSG